MNEKYKVEEYYGIRFEIIRRKLVHGAENTAETTSILRTDEYGDCFLKEFYARDFGNQIKEQGKMIDPDVLKNLLNIQQEVSELLHSTIKNLDRRKLINE